MEGSDQKPLIVAGGGIAGLTAALNLCEHGFTTHLIEASHRLGGKLGANWDGKNHNEHAYHILPAWYLNFWSLVKELGIEDQFVDLPIYSFMRPGQFPRTRSLENVGSYKFILKNLRSGLMTTAEMFLYMYSILDLTSHSFSRRVFLDNTSVNGFMRSRWYATDRVAIQHQDILFKTFSVPSYLVSAMSYQNLFKYWLGSPIPTMRMMRGNAQSVMIEPLAQLLRKKGGTISLNTRLDGIEGEGNRVSRVSVRDLSNGSARWLDVEGLVLAIPPERIAALITDQLYSLVPELGDLRQLETSPIASLVIYFTRRLPNIPANVVSLLESTYGLTFIDNSQLWGRPERTFLNVVATKFLPLSCLSAELAQREILGDLKRFIPFEDSDIDYIDYQSHLEEPLFSCMVGSWQYRPRTKSELSGLYFCGDYCRSHVDVTCLESAVTTGLNAASALIDDCGVKNRVVVRRPVVLPRWGLIAAKYGLLPVAAACYCWARLSDRLRSGLGPP